MEKATKPVTGMNKKQIVGMFDISTTVCLAKKKNTLLSSEPWWKPADRINKLYDSNGLYTNLIGIFAQNKLNFCRNARWMT